MVFFFCEIFETVFFVNCQVLLKCFLKHVKSLLNSSGAWSTTLLKTQRVLKFGPNLVQNMKSRLRPVPWRLKNRANFKKSDMNFKLLVLRAQKELCVQIFRGTLSVFIFLLFSLRTTKSQLSWITDRSYYKNTKIGVRCHPNHHNKSFNVTSIIWLVS